MEKNFLSLGILYYLGINLVSPVTVEKDILVFKNTQIEFPNGWGVYLRNLDCITLEDLTVTSLVELFTNSTNISAILKEGNIFNTVLKGNIFYMNNSDLLEDLTKEVSKIKSISTYETILAENLQIPIITYNIIKNSINALKDLKLQIKESLVKLPNINKTIVSTPNICLKNSFDTLIIEKLLIYKGYLNEEESVETLDKYASDLYTVIHMFYEEIFNILCKDADTNRDIDIVINNIMSYPVVKFSITKHEVELFDKVKEIALVLLNSILITYFNYMFANDMTKVTVSTKKYIIKCLNYICGEDLMRVATEYKIV